MCLGEDVLVCHYCTRVLCVCIVGYTPTYYAPALVLTERVNVCEDSQPDQTLNSQPLVGNVKLHFPMGSSGRHCASISSIP